MRWSPYSIGPWVTRVPADHAWRTITGADEMKRNGWDECGEMVEWNLRYENGRNPVKNLPRPRFVHHETHMEGPRRGLGTPAVGGERLTACATRPPNIFVLFESLFTGLRAGNPVMYYYVWFSVLGTPSIIAPKTCERSEIMRTNKTTHLRPHSHPSLFS